MNADGVKDLVEKLLEPTEFQVLPKKHLNSAVDRFVNKDEKSAIEEMVLWQVKESNKQLLARDRQGGPELDEESIRKEVRASFFRGAARACSHTDYLCSGYLCSGAARLAKPPVP